MLLRSSSTPLLDCLHASPLSHSEPSPDCKNEGDLTAGDGQAPLCVSLHTSRGGPHLPHPHMHLDSQYFPPAKLSGWASCVESPVGLPPSNHVRKVQSENDLCSLGGGGSVTSARVAANTLLQDSLVDECFPGSAIESYSSCCYLPHVKKGRAFLPLSRRRSLGSLPSELPSVFFCADSTDSDFAILEEGELSPSLSSVASEADENGETQSCIFDKIALPVSNSVHSKHCGGIEHNARHVGGKSFMGLLEKDIVKAPASCQRDGVLWAGLDEVDMVASSSGRQELDMVLRQSQLTSAMTRNGMVSTLSRDICGSTSSSHYVCDGDKLEVAHNGGDGGHGARPPVNVSGGGGGGGGDAGGRGSGSSEVADQHYQRVLQKDPGNYLLLRNYAQYLADVKHDYRKAEEFFQRAILASPSDGELLGQYAKMLWEVKHDTERAADYFERAVQAAPDNSYVMAAYASFLWSSEEEEEEQESTDYSTSFPSLVSAGLA
ncbi:hypothetical protein GOP47_0025474 [Adiantum capillus-veneris]|nr:hypothetical protein GOP47_0025474 [Adiantum capillus-veneris]